MRLREPSRAYGGSVSVKRQPSLSRWGGRLTSWCRWPSRRRSSRRRWVGHGVLIEVEPMLPTRGYRVLCHDATLIDLEAKGMWPTGNV